MSNRHGNSRSRRARRVIVVGITALASLASALGTDFGLSGIEGFGASGYSPMYMSGANLLAFNFGDCGLAPVSAPQHFWLARKYDVPAFSWFRLEAIAQGNPSRGVTTVLDLLWYDDSGRDFDVKTLPLDRHFRVAECASMRSAARSNCALRCRTGPTSCAKT